MNQSSNIETRLSKEHLLEAITEYFSPDGALRYTDFYVEANIEGKPHRLVANQIELVLLGVQTRARLRALDEFSDLAPADEDVFDDLED